MQKTNLKNYFSIILPISLLISVSLLVISYTSGDQITGFAILSNVTYKNNLYDQTLTISSGNDFIFKLNEPMDVSYTISSNKPIDVYIFSDSSSYDNFKSNRNFEYYISCSAKSSMNIYGECVVPKDSVIVIIPYQKTNIKVNINGNKLK